jgi:hypothetical protein
MSYLQTSNLKTTNSKLTVYYSDFFFALFALAGLAGRLLPNEPCAILPYCVFLSPLPIVFKFIDLDN